MTYQHPLPEAREIDGRHAADGEGRWRRVTASPFFFIGIVLAGFLLLGVLLLIAVQFQGAPGPLTVPGALKTTMPDGSILWLKVTGGPQHDFQFEYPEPDPLERVFDPTSIRQVDAHTDEQRFVIWLMRQDPVTGQPLDVDWWSHSSVVDEHGTVLVDSNPHRDSFHAHGSRGWGGDRPFPPLDPRDDVGIVARSELPLFRHSGQTFTLRIHDTGGEVVARFSVPYKLPVRLPNWSPEELPVTKSHGELAVTLKEVAFEEREYVVNGRSMQDLRIRPEIDVQYGGEPTDVWRITPKEVSDPLGNRDSLWRCDLLDRHEAAWRLHVRAVRTAEAEFSPEEKWRLPRLTIPEVNQARPLAQEHTAQETRLRLIGIGGTGRSVHNAIDPERRGGGGGRGGSFRTAAGERIRYDIDVDYRNGTKSISVECPLPHVVFEMTGRDSDQSLFVQAVGEDGQQVPTHLNSTPSLGAVRVVFLEPPARDKHVDLTFILHRTYAFEFFIKPPSEEGPNAGD